MKLADFKIAQQLLREYDEIQKKIDRIDNIVSREKGSTVNVGLTGEVLELPKLVVLTKLNAKKQELEQEKTQLEEEFNKL